MQITFTRAGRIAASVAALGALAVGSLVTASPAQADDPTPPAPGPHYVPGAHVFPGNDGKPHKVTWDKNSFKVDGQRLHIWSGEFHPWRLPDPQAWRDLLQKIKANGYNAVSFYFFWGLHQTEENGPFNFDKGTIRDLDLLLTMAQEEGLYVIVRPGPYVNAEISMGGFPAYMTNFTHPIRSDAERSLKAQKAWLHAFNEIAKKHQITDGGGSIIMYQVENELLNDTTPRYKNLLKELVKAVKADGITVPLFHNDWGAGGRYRNIEEYGTSFYATDYYPVGFNCSANRNGNWEGTLGSLRGYAPDSPLFITESQGGAFTPWGANYSAESCYDYTDPAFIRQWGVANLGHGVTAFNFYMAFGGTNWGWTGSPSSGFTSYDYGAGITESRKMTPKASAQKEIGLYQEAVPELTKMDPVDAPKVREHTGGNTLVYSRQAIDGDGSVTGNGVRTIGLRLADANDTTETAFALPLTLDRAKTADAVTVSHDALNEAIRYTGTWDQVDDATAYNSTLKRSRTPGDKAELTFTGTGIRLITATGADHGTFTVSIDGGEAETIRGAAVETDQNKPTRFVAFAKQGLSAGEHTITVTNTGSGDRQVVSIDAFDVVGGDLNQPTVYNNTDQSFFTYTGNWTHATGKSWTAGDINKDESFSNTTGDKVAFSFTGVGFDVIAPYSLNHGSATVHVDGKEVGKTQEQTTSESKPQQTTFSWRAPDGAEPARHEVTLTVDGTPFPSSSGTFVAIDAVKTYATAAQLAPVEAAPSVPDGALGWTRVPQKAGTFLKLHGRDALLLTADKKIAGHDLYYTTSQLFGAPLPTSAGSLQYLLGVSGDDGETLLHYAERPQVEAPEGVEVTWNDTDKTLRLNYRVGATPQHVRITPTADSAQPLMLRIIDRTFAITTWMLDSAGGRVAVEGPEVARTVHITGASAALTGSVSEQTTVRVWAPAAIQTVTWQGTALGAVANGFAEGKVPGPEPVTVAPLEFHKMPDNEYASVDFNDSGWADPKAGPVANPGKDWQGPGGWTKVALDSNHNEFYEGSVWYRAHFTASRSNPTLTIRANAGTGQPGQGRKPGFLQVWANGQYAGALPADNSDHTLAMPAGAVTKGEKVVLAIVVHNLGQNLDWSDNGLSLQNRGLGDINVHESAEGGKVTWKIHGATAESAKDASRNPSGTLYNNGGLGGEDKGWHMPGLDDKDWEAADTLHSPAGVTWYRAHVPLNVAPGVDPSIRLDIESSRFAQRGDKSQLTLFVNGWNTGVYIGDIGPQSSFVVPNHFLNMKGDNVIAVAVAAKEDDAGPEKIRMRVDHVVTTAKSLDTDQPTTPGEDETKPVTPTPGDGDTKPVTPTPGDGDTKPVTPTPGDGDTKPGDGTAPGGTTTPGDANAQSGTGVPSQPAPAARAHLAQTGTQTAALVMLGIALSLGGLALVRTRRA